MSIVSAVLRDMGFYRISEQFQNVVTLAEAMVVNASDPKQSPRFECFPSYIPKEPAAKLRNLALVIDIGGTSTKAGLRVSKDNRTSFWHLLFEIPNDRIRASDQALKPFASFALALAQNIKTKLVEKKVPLSAVDACGIVWSNALKNSPCGHEGIRGTIAQRERYSKGEWFIEQLKNGDEIGQTFVDALNDTGIGIKTHLVANDTPLTMKAHGSSDAGMVASTGLNGTIIAEFDQHKVICNAEMGVRFEIPSDLLSEGDFLGPDIRVTTIEHLASGKFLPKIFVSHILKSETLGLTDLSPLVQFLKPLGSKGWEWFVAEDLSLLLKDRAMFLHRKGEHELFTEKLLDSLASLAHQILHRGGRLAGLIAYSTIFNQLGDKESFTISLDSSLSREIPLYKKSLLTQLSELMPTAKSVDTVLVDRILTDTGYISVPMQGAAAALDNINR